MTPPQYYPGECEKCDEPKRDCCTRSCDDSSARAAAVAVRRVAVLECLLRLQRRLVRLECRARRGDLQVAGVEPRRHVLDLFLLVSDDLQPQPRVRRIGLALGRELRRTENGDTLTQTHTHIIIAREEKRGRALNRNGAGRGHPGSGWRER